MKKMILNVEFEFELEVPDHVKLVTVNEDIGELLFIHGKLLEPELDWRALSKISDDGGLEFEIISDELADEIHDMTKIINKSDMRILSPAGNKKGK
ncbi:MAG: hypothetical protein NT140_09770 [Deltaproteobacteria bacterium]|nr:hypothetical protein [Deltaproteobacteria bacterium]